LFSSFIINSPEDISSGPTEVLFADYSWMEDKKARIGADDTLTLYARGRTNDLNDLVYTWYYQANSESEPVKVEEFFDATLFAVTDDYVEYVKEEDEAFPKKKFYINNSGNYVEYHESDWPDEGIKLYLKRSALIFKADSKTDKTNITGEYFVKVENIKEIKKEGWDDIPGWSNLLISDATSAPCTICAPNELAYDSEFPEAIFLDKPKTNSTITMTVKESSLINDPKITHTWTGTDAKGGSIAVAAIPGEKGSTSATITTPGIYKLSSKSELNRHTSSVATGTCKVTNLPKPVAASSIVYNKNDKVVANWKDWITKDASPKVWATVEEGDTFVEDNAIFLGYSEYFYLKAVTPTQGTLDSDYLTYEWYYATEDTGYSKWTKITNNLAGDGKLVPKNFVIDEKDPFIALYCNWFDSDAKQDTVAFKCKIYNTIGAEVSSPTESAPIYATRFKVTE
jgi:hypothetical protein